MAVAVVELKVTDTELVRSLIDDVAAAARQFGSLGDGEMASLPESVQAGIGALRRACERATGAVPPARTPDGRPVLWGRIGIEWPAPDRRHDIAQPLVTWKISIWDAVTGTAIYTAEKAVLRASADGWVTADLTMLADNEGKPVLDSSGKVWTDDEGGILKGTFTFLVAEMRVAAS